MTIFLPPAVSIIVPVLNESGIIDELIDHLLSASVDYRTEIIIVDGDPAGSTIRAIRSHQVKRLIGPPGRGPQMNAGAKAAKGIILLFLHADTRLPFNAIGDVIDTCHGRGIAGGTFSLGIDDNRRIFRIMEKWANIRSDIMKIPYGDQAIFIRKNAFLDIGGYARIPIMEDLDMMKRLKKGGFKIKILEKPVRTSSRRWVKEGVIYCIIRNNVLSSLFHAGVEASRLRRFYR